jgi:hypothetical protein
MPEDVSSHSLLCPFLSVNFLDVPNWLSFGNDSRIGEFRKAGVKGAISVGFELVNRDVDAVFGAEI